MDIRIEDDVDISRFHAIVTPLPDGRLMVSDFYSRNGVLVDAGKQKRKLLPTQGGAFGSGPIAVLAVGEKFYIGSFADTPEVTTRIDTSAYDPWTGHSAAAIGYRGRSQHRSQDMGMIEYEEPRGPSL